MANSYQINQRQIVDAKATTAALRALGEDVTEIVSWGVQAALQPIYVAQVALCPVRTEKKLRRRDLRPGEMKASIRKKLVVYKPSGKVVGLVGPSGRAKYVAHLVEFGHLVVAPIKGTSIRKGTAKVARNGVQRVPPHPFIRPSVLNTIPAQAAAFTSKASVVWVDKVRKYSR